MKTIARNHHRTIAAIKRRTLTCQVFRLEDDFVGKTVEPRWAWEALTKYQSARLTERGEGYWHITVHGNLWYELREDQPIAYAKADDLTDDGHGRIRIHDADDAEIDVIEYAADDDETRAWVNVAAALADAGYRVITDWADSADDFRGPRARVVRGE